MVHRGLTVYPVFDGGSPPCKARTAAERLRSRNLLEVSDQAARASQETALRQLVAAEEADEVDEDVVLASVERAPEVRAPMQVSPALVDTVLNGLRSKGMAYLVAPYEADHQLVHMSQRSIIDYVLSVDSDFLCHAGVRLLVLRASTGFEKGHVKLFDFGNMPAEAGEAAGELGELGKIVRHAQALLSESPAAEVGASVCRAYALLVKNDYGKLAGVGPKMAMNVITYLLASFEPSEDPQKLTDPKRLVAAIKKTCALVPGTQALEGHLEDEAALGGHFEYCNKGFSRGRVYWLARCPTERLVFSLDGGVGEDGIVGAAGWSAQEAFELAVGLRCNRSQCGSCTASPSIKHDLVPHLNVYWGPACFRPLKLTYDLVPGSKLDIHQVPDANLKVLRTWLRSRNLSPTGNKQVLRDRVLLHLKQELEDPASVTLFSEDGLSAIEYMVIRNQKRGVRAPPLRGTELVFDTRLLQHVTSSGDWVKDMAAISSTAPVLTEDVLRGYYACRDVNASGCTKVLERGFQRHANRCILQGFGFLLNVLTKPGMCAFRLNCPRSMHTDYVQVFVLCEVDRISEPARIKEVICVWCECIAAKDGKCVHGASLLQIVRDLERPAGFGAESSPTAAACRWNRPGSRPGAWARNKPLSTLPVREVTGPRGEPQERTCHRTDKGRAEWNPWPEGTLDAVAKRILSDDPEETRAALEPLAQLVRALEMSTGEASAAAQLYDPDLPVHRKHGWKMWKSAAKRYLEKFATYQEKMAKEQEELDGSSCSSESN